MKNHPSSTHYIPKGLSSLTADLRILDIIEQYAPRERKTNRNPKNRYSMRCPLPGHESDQEHRDHSGSFSVDETQQVFHCFGCDGQGNALQLYRILAGEEPDYQSPQPPSQPRLGPQTQAQRDSFQGVTIAQLAGNKGLDPSYLRNSLGWRNSKYRGATPAIKIPYYDENKQNPQIRYRVGLDQGDRFRWQSGAKPGPYGLWFLPSIREMGFCILVEGETDFAALSYNDYPALGVPGARIWTHKWASYLQSLNAIYVWQEPGRAGQEFVKRLAESFFHIKVIQPPLGIKDPTEVLRW